MYCRGVRGATTVATDDAAEITAATQELLRAIVAANDMRVEDIISVYFTTTPDIGAMFPAKAARDMGWDHVPLLDAQATPVSDDLPRCIRVLIHWNTNHTQPEIRHIYRGEAASLRPDLISEKRSEEMTTVAFQGEHGAYSEETIYQFFGRENITTLPCRSFDELFRAVETGEADYGAQPVENSTAGSINKAYDLLLDHDLRIWGEVFLRVRHCLLAPSGTKLAEIKQVKSHPQALAQCERYITQRGWEAITVYDTAGSARDLAAQPEPGVAAIASKLAAEIYDLDILANGIEDLTTNYTRFFIIGHEDPPRAERSKTSIVFTTRHVPGALYKCMGQFAERDINVSKLESRPRRNHPWHYLFYLDFEGHWEDSACEAALVGLLRESTFLKVLGSYPAASLEQEK